MGYGFTSPQHRIRLVTTIQKLGKVDNGGKLDPEYASALYLLTASAGTWQKAEEYVSRRGIDFEAMLEEADFSGGFSVLIALASNLFNGNAHIDPLEFLRLDEKNFQLALDAIKLRRYGSYIDDL